MDHRLYDVMNGLENNHLLPFLWMHEGHHDELPQLVQQVFDSGARAFCVESRPYEHFCEQAWWDDMDVVLAEARKRDMKVWILDDRHFPTGYANGLIAQKYPHLRKWQLIEEHMDVVGPAKDNAILLSAEAFPEDTLIGVFAYLRSREAETLDGQAIDLSAHVRGRYVFWDVPEGVYRVFALYKSRRGAEQADYIHMIDPESVRVQIEAVYEPHYQRYRHLFGNTIAGFFSDEPSFGNRQLARGGAAHSMYDQRLGQPGLALPWTDEVLACMNDALGADALPLLPGLWYCVGDGLPRVRLAYMDAVTRLWQRHFSDQIGKWCRAHGVEYIGHIIEDMNAHARLGCGGGHYFRALDGQDMAGIDVVLHQIIPGLAHYDHAASCAGGYARSAFFDYALARLATSHSHIQPRMKGRAMCEVFGAYGWAEGVPMMKRLMDHMLVRGINHFVPHAFSPKFPDPDCPPHFNAGGLNPQFSAFAQLMRYTNQTAHLLYGGTEIVSAAILYHAEAEWSGREAMLMQEPARRLLDAQLNYDFLPIDAIMENARVENGRLEIEQMQYPALIVPYAAYLPDAFLARLRALEANGLTLAFVDARPDEYDGGAVVPLPLIEDFVRDTCGAADICLNAPFPLLRFFHIKREGTDTFFFVNESAAQPYDGEVRLPVQGTGVRADLQLHCFSRICAKSGKIRLRLACGQSALFIFGCEMPADLLPMPEYERREAFNGEWKLSLRRFNEPEFTKAIPLAQPYNITGANGDASFSGWMQYEAVFVSDGRAAALSLGQVGQCVRAWLNGVDLGERFDAPYLFSVEGTLRAGVNHLRLVVANSLVHAIPDPFSRYIQIPPSGLLGPVEWLYAE